MSAEQTHFHAPHNAHGVIVDLKMVKDFAESVAKTAASEIAQELREEMYSQHRQLREEILEGVRKEIQAYHGDMTPTEHAVQHNRMSRILKWMDRTTDNVWGQVISSAIKFIIFMFLVGYFVWTQGLFGVGG